MLEFLGAPPYELDAFPRIFEREYAPMEPATRRLLVERFTEPNRRLYDLLGRDLGWA